MLKITFGWRAQIKCFCQWHTGTSILMENRCWCFVTYTQQTAVQLKRLYVRCERQYHEFHSEDKSLNLVTSGLRVSAVTPHTDLTVEACRGGASSLLETATIIFTCILYKCLSINLWMNVPVEADLGLNTHFYHDFVELHHSIPGQRWQTETECDIKNHKVSKKVVRTCLL